jgi:RNA polymerase sigma factor (sigma-70 family)
MDDKRIIAEMKKGNPVAFNSLYEKYYKPLFSFAYTKMGNVQDAEDIVQERFLVLLTNESIWSRITDLRPYLYRMVNNACLHELSSHESKSKKEQLYGQYLTTGHENELPEILQQMNDESRISIMTPLLSNLGRQCRRALELVYMEDKSYIEAGKIMGVSKESIKTHLSIGKSYFRKRIDTLINLAALVCLIRLW